MQLNPTLAQHYTAHVRSAAPLNRSKIQVLRKRTPELNDSKDPTHQLTSQKSQKITYKSLKKALKNQLFGPTNPGSSHTQRPIAHPLETKNWYLFYPR
jgi:hypothetical protein